MSLQLLSSYSSILQLVIISSSCFLIEAGEQQSISEVPPESTNHSPSASDFDPSSPCAFSPPAYDTLPKDPPAYADIFTISNGCSYDNNPSNQTQTSLQLESICNAVNQSHPLSEENINPTYEEIVPRGPGPSSAVDLSPPYRPSVAVSPDQAPPPPSYTSRPTGRVQRPSLSLAMELHPLNLGVSGSRFSSPTHSRVFPAAV